MAEFVVMPKLGFDMREGVLVKWLYQIGQQVNKGDVVAEIESDKATLELESQVSGILLHTIQEAGAVVPVGANMAVVGKVGEDISGLVGGNGAVKVGVATPAGSPPADPPTVTLPAGSPAISQEFPGGVKATPLARRIAKENEVDLRQVAPSGPESRIRKADVESFILSRPVTSEAPTPVIAAPPPPPPTAEATLIETSRLRKAIARRMTESKAPVPHFYVTTSVDMEPALALRKQINTLLPDEQKVTVNDLIVKAVALALRDFPNLNASYGGDKLIRHRQINVGSAVAVDGGLLTVVQKNSDSASLSKIAADNKAMIARAREGKVKPDDIEGSTFTVSNLGAYDVDHFVAIINPPEAAILAVGTAQQIPVVKGGQLTVGTRMKATISADHRVTDGAEAAQFLQRFKALLEAPMRLLL